MRLSGRQISSTTLLTTLTSTTLRLPIYCSSEAIARQYKIRAETRSFASEQRHYSKGLTQKAILREQQKLQQQQIPRSKVGPRRPQRRQNVKLLVAASLASVGLFYLYSKYLSKTSNHSRLDPKTFSRYKVVAKEQVSPNSYLLTVQPESNTSIKQEAYPTGLWSVEIKQPNLQIARHYTPLPPLGSVETETGQLRFLIRRYNGGEVSTYLSRQSVGDVIFLRGPHFPSAGVLSRVEAAVGNEESKVLFLAGGTGVAPALQVASAISRSATASFRQSKTDRSIDDATPKMTTLWANRSRNDCVGCLAPVREAPTSSSIWSWGLAKKPKAPEQQSQLSNSPNPILKQVGALQAHTTDDRRIGVYCVVDEEGTRIDEDDIMKIIRSASPRSPVDGMSYSAENIENLAVRDAKDTTSKATTRDQAMGGAKNVILVSGPEGFVEALAGPTVWADGAERQGKLGGMLGKLRDQYPKEWASWTVLKL